MTVIIPAHNESGLIASTVRSALEQTYPIEQVIVAVNGSTDSTAEEAEAAGATVVICPETGKAKAQNHALPLATGQVIVLLDADTILDPDCVRLMVEDLDRGYDATCCAVMPQQRKGLFVRARRFEYALARRWWKKMHKAVGFVYVLSGCGAAVRKEALERIGGFPHAIISEDTEMTWKLYAAKFRVTYTPKAVCYSREPETWKVYRAQARRWASGSFQIIGRNKRLLKRPGAALVVFGSLWDLLWLPATIAGWALTGFSSFTTLTVLLTWIIAQNVITLTIASRELGVKDALLCFPASKLLSVPNRMIYIWALFREWILGVHFQSWTGRQGSKTVLSKLKPRRVALGAMVLAVYGATAVTGVELPKRAYAASGLGPAPYDFSVLPVESNCPNGYVAVTYDDGPGSKTLPILEEIHKSGMRATFFVVGQEVTTHPEEADLIWQSGGSMENHSWTHPHLSELTGPEVEDQLLKSSDAIDATGPRPTLFRPPYGDTAPYIRDVAENLGMAEALWNISDWQAKDTEDMLDRIRTAEDGDIILMHGSWKSAGNSTETDDSDWIEMIPEMANILHSKGLCSGRIVPDDQEHESDLGITQGVKVVSWDENLTETKPYESSAELLSYSTTLHKALPRTALPETP